MSTNYSTVNETVNDDSQTFRPNYTVSSDLPSGTSADQYENAKVVALAGLAAGALAGIGAMIGERKNQPKSKAEQARIALEEAAERARKDTGISTKDAKKKAKDAKRKGEDQQEQIDRLLADFRKQSSDKADTAKDKADDAKSSLMELLAKAKDQASSTYDEKAPEVAETMSTVKEKAADKGAEAKDNAGSLMEAIKDKLSEAEEEYVEKIAIPKLKEMGAGALAAMIVGKEKSGELTDKAKEDLLPQAKDQMGKAKETVAQTLGSLKDNAKPMSEDAQNKLSDVASTAQSKAGEASDAVKKTSKETRSFLMWTGLAAALVYNVFLNEDQQATVKKVLGEIFGEAKTMYMDQQKNS